MATPEGDLVVTFNGEIYNYIELRAQLERYGHNFHTNSDTEVLLFGYRAWGTELPNHLTGAFAFAIADRLRHQLFLARDRFGEKPLFLVQAKGYLAFASELRPLAALSDLPRALDIEALGCYLSLNYVPGTATLMKGVHRLLPASWMCFHADGSSQTCVYWSMKETYVSAHVRRQSKASILEELRQRLDHAVALCLRSDVPVGIFLSGGIDSSLVAESAVRQGRLSYAYFLDFEQASYSEYEAASQVARHLGLPLVRITMTSDVLEHFISLVEHADDPLADSSGLAVWAISQLASQESKVVLGGDGGDELFSGYLTYQASLMHGHLQRYLPTGLRQVVAQFSHWLPTTEGKVTFSFKLRRFLRALHLPTQEAHFTWNGTWLPEEAAALMRSSALCKVVSSSLSAMTHRLGLDDPMAGNDLHRLQRADIQEYLSNDILAKVDRMSMAHSLEVRVPLLDYKLAEWAMGLPEELKVNWMKGELKVLPRALARQVFGSQIAGRPKSGFSIPIHTWVRGPLKAIVCDLLSPAAIEALQVFDPLAVQRVLDAHFSGKRSYGFEIWGLAVLAAWHRIRIQNAPIQPLPQPLIERILPLRVTS